MPLVRRIPKRGFHNRLRRDGGHRSTSATWKPHFDAGDEVTPESLREHRPRQGPLRRAEGAGRRRADQEAEDLGPPFSRSALEKIEKAGGQAVVLPGKAPVVKNVKKQKTAKA